MMKILQYFIIIFKGLYKNTNDLIFQIQISLGDPVHRDIGITKYTVYNVSGKDKFG